MQTSYADPAGGQAGQLVDSAFTDKVTGVAQAALVEMGRYVAVGDAKDRIAVPAAATDITSEAKLGGVVLRQQSIESAASGAATGEYPRYSACPVLKKGRVWVVTEDDITVGTSTVNVRYAGTGTKGAFRGAAVSMETAVLPRSRWLTGGTAGTPCQLEINL